MSTNNASTNNASDVQGSVEVEGRGFVRGHGKSYTDIGLRELERR